MYSSPRREFYFAAARLLQRLDKRCRKVSPRRKLSTAAARTYRVTSPRRWYIFAAARRFWVTLAAARIWFRRGEDPTTLILSVVESSRRGEKYTSPRRDPTTLRISVVGALKNLKFSNFFNYPRPFISILSVFFSSHFFSSPLLSLSSFSLSARPSLSPPLSCRPYLSLSATLSLSRPLSLFLRPSLR